MPITICTKCDCSLVGTCGSGWHTSEAEVISSYRSFSDEKIHGKMGIYIGLLSANITLEAMHYNKSMDVNFNERYTILQHSYQIFELDFTIFFFHTIND